jgi:hypothetical protein
MKLLYDSETRMHTAEDKLAAVEEEKERLRSQMAVWEHEETPVELHMLLGVLGLSMSTMYFASAYYRLKGHSQHRYSELTPVNDGVPIESLDNSGV